MSHSRIPVRASRRRGVSMLASIIVMGVMVVLVAAAITFTGQERKSAGQHLRSEALNGCVQAARNVVVSQLRGGAAGAALDLDAIRGQVATGEYRMRTGHLDDPTDGGGPGVTACADDGDNTAWAAMDLTNTVVDPNAARAGAGRCYSIVASCQDLETQASREIEFQLRIAF